MKITKGVESQLSVWALTGEKPRLVGTLDLWDSPFRRAEFVYATSWLQDVGAYALDPINLPLSTRRFATTSRFEVMGAIFDAAPDAWGRTVMAASIGSHPNEMPERDVLLIGRGSGVGALGFSKSGTVLHRPVIFQPMISDIESIFQATREMLADGKVMDDSLLPFVTSSWDIGGARPKSEVTDKDGYKWIAKFPGKNDRFSCQRAEWANLEMARRIGMRVPEAKLVDLSSGDAALLIKRFDRSQDDEVRRHYLSAVSLISPPANFDKFDMDTLHGARYFSYSAIADVMKKVSSNYSHDLAELFARMAFNVFVSNKDDHLKNHGFLKQAQGHKYELSPLFDVATQTNPGNKHSLHIGPNFREGTIENVIEGGRRMGLSMKFIEKQALPEIKSVLTQRRRYYSDAGFTSKEIEKLETYLHPEVCKLTQSTQVASMDFIKCDESRRDFEAP